MSDKKTPTKATHLKIATDDVADVAIADVAIADVAIAVSKPVDFNSGDDILRYIRKHRLPLRFDGRFVYGSGISIVVTDNETISNVEILPITAFNAESAKIMYPAFAQSASSSTALPFGTYIATGEHRESTTIFVAYTVQEILDCISAYFKD